MKSTTAFAFVLLALCCDCTVSAVTINTVPIGNPGNAADTRYIDIEHPSGIGSVAQVFNIGKTEVTNAQYLALLNAVAATDPYGLYSAGMAGDSRGGIVRSGESGSYTYAIKSPALTGAYTYDNKPVVFVSSGDAMRFANWLNNGQPSGAEDGTTTENGAYTLNGAISDSALVAISRNGNARWWLPSESEWYKAAYYNPGTGTYFNYPTHTSSVPNNNLPSSDTGNSANFLGSNYTTGNSSFPLTDAGAYTLSGSPYGTFDQGGNAWEWNDTLLDGSVQGIRGGEWDESLGSLHASIWNDGIPSDQNGTVGFRIASSAVPEPSTLLLGVLASFGMLARRRR